MQRLRVAGLGAQSTLDRLRVVQSALLEQRQQAERRVLDLRMPQHLPVLSEIAPMEVDDMMHRHRVPTPASGYV